MCHPDRSLYLHSRLNFEQISDCLDTRISDPQLEIASDPAQNSPLEFMHKTEFI